MAFPAYPNLRQVIRPYPLADDAAFVEGAAVVLDAGEVDECDADPTSILGFALHDAGADPDPTVMLVALATPESTFVLQGTSAPVAADEGVLYGLVKDSDGVWTVDKTDTTNVRVIVEKVYIDRAQFEVRVLQEFYQMHGAIAHPE